VRAEALVLVVVWLMAANLRTVIFGVQPVLPDIRRDLGLSFGATGALTSAALAVLGLGSLPGALAGSWLGARRTVTWMTAGIGVAALLRLLPVQPAAMFAGTALVSLCASFAQPSATILLRRWFPGRLVRASGVYSNGLLMGGTVAAVGTSFLASTIGWRGSFVLWGAAALAVAVAWAAVTPRQDAPVARLSLRAALGSSRAWGVTALFTFQNLAYFGAAAWLPFLLAGRSPAYVGWVFVCLNLLPVLPLLVLPWLPWPYATSRAFYLVQGVLTLLGAAGLALGLRDAAWLLALMIGLGCGATFVGAMALPPLVARGEAEAGAITAVVFTFGYLFALWSPLVAGWLVDGTGSVSAAFWPSAAAGVLMSVVGLLVPRAIAGRRAETAA
jgi:MFS transporter, CP family, cyanate transporter